MTNVEQVMQSLEAKCVAHEVLYCRLMAHVTSDEQAAQYGAHVARVAHTLPMSESTVRRVLEVEVAAGRVLRHKLPYGPVTYWPVGLWARLQ